jgi:NNP family nitrate/nitrite transporter-like MFS transporter
MVSPYVPGRTGAVTGLVGAAGGLGGFFPPLVLGTLKDATGSYAWGFILRSFFALGCGWVLWRVFLSRKARQRLAQDHFSPELA